MVFSEVCAIVGGNDFGVSIVDCSVGSNDGISEGPTVGSHVVDELGDKLNKSVGFVEITIVGIRDEKLLGDAVGLDDIKFVDIADGE